MPDKENLGKDLALSDPFISIGTTIAKVGKMIQDQEVPQSVKDAYEAIKAHASSGSTDLQKAYEILKAHISQAVAPKLKAEELVTNKQGPNQQNILDTLPDVLDSLPDKEEKPGILAQASKYLTDKPNAPQEVNSLLKGGLADPNLSVMDKITQFLSGRTSTPEGIPIVQPGMQSLIPDLKHPADESWLGYGARALFNTLISPLGSPSGFIGAAAPSSGTLGEKLLASEAPEAEQGIAKIGEAVTKPKFRINGDGTFTDLSTGEIIDKTGKPVATSESKFSLHLGPSIAEDTGIKGDLAKIKQEQWDRIANRPEGTGFNHETGQIVPLDESLGGKKLASEFGNAGGEPPKILDTLPDSGDPTGGGEGTGSKILKETNKYQDLVNATREIRASVDLSAPLRQGLPLAYRKEWWTSLDDMVKAFGSEDAYKAINDSIHMSPYFKPTVTATGEEGPSFANKAGVFIADHLSNTEEAYAAKWLSQGKYNPIRMSERAYTTFLNKLRADTFESLMNTSKALGEDPESNLHVAKALADFVNTSTGRGSLFKSETAATVLNNTLFAPKLMEARLQMMNPAYYINQPKSIRLEKLKALITLAGTGTMMGELAKMGGAEIENDPASADFRKIKIGNVRLDPYGGQQQYFVLLNRLLPAIEGAPTGRFKSTTNNSAKGQYELSNPPFGGMSRQDILFNFATNKLNPVLGVANDILVQSKKRPFNISHEAAQLFAPMFMQDVYDLYQDQTIGTGTKLGIGALGALGMGQQVYGARTPN
jgi:hypothetical protein